MVKSRHSKIAGLLPRLGGRIPAQDFSEKETTSYIENIVNQCSSQVAPWCWKLAGLHLPPLQLAVTSSVSGNLVGVRVAVVKDFCRTPTGGSDPEEAILSSLSLSRWLGPTANTVKLFTSDASQTHITIHIPKAHDTYYPLTPPR